METKVIVAYVVCDDTIKNLKIKDDTQAKISTAEVMTTAIISAIRGAQLHDAVRSDDLELSSPHF